MVEFIHLDLRIEKQLDVLRKEGKKGAIAAREAEKIIEQLLRERRLPDCLNQATRKGEKRMRRCVKFDLGNGYRMVTLRQKNTLHIAFVGTHDESDRWIAHNKRLPIDTPKIRSRRIPVPPAPSRLTQNSGSNFPEEPEPDPFPPVDEKTLRIVFSGLTGSAGLIQPHPVFADYNENPKTIDSEAG